MIRLNKEQPLKKPLITLKTQRPTNTPPKVGHKNQEQSPKNKDKKNPSKCVPQEWSVIRNDPPNGGGW